MIMVEVMNLSLWGNTWGIVSECATVGRVRNGKGRAIRGLGEEEASLPFNRDLGFWQL